MVLRLERKYVLAHSLKEYLLAQWSPHIRRAPYTNDSGAYPVFSQYYDSPTLAFYDEKLAGVGLRRKIRLRTYGYGFLPGQHTSLEIKQRINDRVLKIRCPLPAFDPTFVSPMRWPSSSADGLGIFHALRDTYNLRPSAQVFYLRAAYQGILDPSLRITFDSCLTGLHPGERLTRAVLYDQTRAILPETQLILEIKSHGLLPNWVLRAVHRAQLKQDSVPKYVLAVTFLGLKTLQTGVYL